VAMSELEMLQRDIDGLLDTNRLDWLALANEPMSSEQRIEVRKAIAARNVDLLELLQRKWDPRGGCRRSMIRKLAGDASRPVIEAFRSRQT